MADNKKIDNDSPEYRNYFLKASKQNKIRERIIIVNLFIINKF